MSFHFNVRTTSYFSNLLTLDICTSNKVNYTIDYVLNKSKLKKRIITKLHYNQHKTNNHLLRPVKNDMDVSTASCR